MSMYSGSPRRALFNGVKKARSEGRMHAACWRCPTRERNILRGTLFFFKTDATSLSKSTALGGGSWTVRCIPLTQYLRFSFSVSQRASPVSTVVSLRLGLLRQASLWSEVSGRHCGLYVAWRVQSFVAACWRYLRLLQGGNNQHKRPTSDGLGPAKIVVVLAL
jgi:hypothetical protein